MPKKKSVSQQLQNVWMLQQSWGGVPHYQCDACPFDTFDRKEMLEHLFNKHNSERAMNELIAEEEARKRTSLGWKKSTEEVDDATNKLD